MSKDKFYGVLVFGAILLVFFALIFFVNSSVKLTGTGSIAGHSILSLNAFYTTNNSLEGNISLALKNGELIPSDSIVVIDINGSEYNYTLSNVVNNQQVSGNYYLIDQNLNGSGQGYGVAGEKVTYPDVSFSFRVSNSGNSSTSSSGSSTSSNSSTSSSNSSTSSSNSSTSSSNSTNSNNSSQNVSVSSNQTVSSNNSSSSSSNSVSNNTASSNQSVSNSASSSSNSSTSSSNSASSNSNSNSQASNVSNSASSNSNSNTQSNANAASSNSNTASSNSNSNSNSASSNSNSNSSAPITGNVIAQQGDLSGSVSFDKPFSYNLNDGQTAEIINSDQPVSSSINNNVFSVTTNYSTSTSGFGADYIGSDSNMLNIDLNSLGLKPVEGQISVSIVSQGKKILFINSNLAFNQSSNATTEQNQTLNKTIENENISAYTLTPEELFTLKAKTGASEVTITKSEIVNNQLIIRFELGSYWLEKSYDSSWDSNLIKNQINLDEAKWVKSLAQSLSTQSSSSKDAKDYLGNYSLG